jgi:hypothetical protein
VRAKRAQRRCEADQKANCSEAGHTLGWWGPSVGEAGWRGGCRGETPRQDARASAAEAGSLSERKESACFCGGSGQLRSGLSGGDPPNPPYCRRGRTCARSVAHAHALARLHMRSLGCTRARTCARSFAHALGCTRPRLTVPLCSLRSHSLHSHSLRSHPLRSHSLRSQVQRQRRRRPAADPGVDAGNGNDNDGRRQLALRQLQQRHGGPGLTGTHRHALESRQPPQDEVRKHGTRTSHPNPVNQPPALTLFSRTGPRYLAQQQMGHRRRGGQRPALRLPQGLLITNV